MNADKLSASRLRIEVGVMDDNFVCVGRGWRGSRRMCLLYSDNTVDWLHYGTLSQEHANSFFKSTENHLCELYQLLV